MACCKDVIDFGVLSAVAEEGCSTRGYCAVPPASKDAAEVIACA
jgi:hypothetical protein